MVKSVPFADIHEQQQSFVSVDSTLLGGEEDASPMDNSLHKRWTCSAEDDEVDSLVSEDASHSDADSECCVSESEKEKESHSASNNANPNSTNLSLTDIFMSSFAPLQFPEEPPKKEKDNVSSVKGDKGNQKGSSTKKTKANNNNNKQACSKTSNKYCTPLEEDESVEDSSLFSVFLKNFLDPLMWGGFFINLLSTFAFLLVVEYFLHGPEVLQEGWNIFSSRGVLTFFFDVFLEVYESIRNEIIWILTIIYTAVSDPFGGGTQSSLINQFGRQAIEFHPSKEVLEATASGLIPSSMTPYVLPIAYFKSATAILGAKEACAASQGVVEDAQRITESDEEEF